MIDEIRQVSWFLLLAFVALGTLSLSIGLKLSASRNEKAKDPVGVRYAERGVILLYNGLFLFALALIGSLLKLA